MKRGYPFDPLRKPRKAPVKTDKSWLSRWYAAHYKWHEQEYPQGHRDGHYSKPTVPKVSTANGLTNAICHYVRWIGGVSNRINVQGRKIEHKDKSFDGKTIVSSSGYMTSSTLKGTADILASLPNGKTWHIEIKTGNDKPRPEQIAMQQRILKAKGHYDFVHDMGEFFSKLDLLIPETLF